MAFDPSILNGGTVISPPNPLSTLADVMKIGVLGNQLQSGQADAAIKQRAILGQQQFDQAFPQLVTPLMKGDQQALQTLMGSLAQQYPAAAKMLNDVQFSWQKDQAELRKSGADTANKEADTKQKYATLLSSQANAISQLPNVPPQFVTGLAQQAAKWGLDGVIAPILSGVSDPNDSAQVKTALRLIPLAFVTPTEQVGQQNANIGQQNANTTLANVGSEIQRRAAQTALETTGREQEAAKLQLENVGVNPQSNTTYQKLPGLAIPTPGAQPVPGMTASPDGMRYSATQMAQLNQGRGQVLAAEYAEQARNGQVNPALAQEIGQLSPAQRSAFDFYFSKSGSANAPQPQAAPAQTGAFTPQQVGPSFMQQKVGEQTAKEVGELGTKALAARTGQMALQGMREQEAKGILSGGIQGTETFRTLANVWAATGLATKAQVDKLANTQAWDATSGELVAEMLKQLGGNRITNNELGFMRNIKPNTLQTGEGRQQLYDILGRAFQNQMDLYETAAGSAQRPGAYDFAQMSPSMQPLVGKSGTAAPAANTIASKAPPDPRANRGRFVTAPDGSVYRSDGSQWVKQ